MSTLFLSAEETQYLAQQPQSRLAPWLRDRLNMGNVPQDVKLHVSGPTPDAITQAWVTWTAPVTTFTSPDGGHTIIRHDQNGQALHWQDQTALKRRRLGYLQQAITIADRDDLVMEYLTEQIEAVLVFARLRGHDIQDWSDQ